MRNLSVDVKYFTICDHIVSGQAYKQALCPRCRGVGYYLDIMFDKAGLVVTTTSETKLQQEMLKVLLDEKGSDTFYPYWGSEINSFLGHKKTLVTKSRLEVTIPNALERLKSIQAVASATDPTMDDTEIINEIQDIQLEDVSATEWKITVQVSSRSNESYRYEVVI